MKKGYQKDVDSYSAFGPSCERNGVLNELLKRNGISKVYVCGVASDFCVKHTAIDASILGYNSYIISDATKGTKKDAEDLRSLYESKGIKLIKSQDILE